MMVKRLLDLGLTLTGALALLPFALIMMAWIKADSHGPVLFRQERVGCLGRRFKIFKFRTMVDNAEALGPQITAGSDARITQCGRILRKYKIDEIPQLLNVIRGEMSLVGPRPEVPRYVAMWPKPKKEIILSVKPGITDLSSIYYSKEQLLLGCSDNHERTYVDEILPNKLALYCCYVAERGNWLDLRIILATVAMIAGLNIISGLLPEMKGLYPQEPS